MKPRLLLLLLSLIVNVVLAFAVASHRLRKTTPADASNAPPVAASGAGETASEALDWQELQTLGHATFVARLRAYGFSPEVVRAIVTAHVNEQFAPRFRALGANAQFFNEYWRGGPGGFGLSRVDPTVRAAQRELSREQSQLLRSLLGESEADYQSVFRRQRYGDLAAEKVEQMEALERDYNDLVAQVRYDSKGVMLQEDRDQIAFLEAEKQADLANLLTPEELQAYELRSSATAGQLRGRLSAFDPSEEEYIALFHLQKAFDDRYGGATANAQQQQRKMEDSGELTRQIASVLGPERFAEYELKTDRAWRESDLWVKQQQLPETATAQLVTINRETTRRVSEIRTNRELTDIQRTAQLAAIAQDAQARVVQVLGADRLSAYEMGPGHWLRNLQPRQR